MKSRPIIILLLGCLLGFSLELHADEFRGFDWTSTPEEVVSKEGWPSQGVSRLNYIETIEGYEYNVRYAFKDGALYGASYAAEGAPAEAADFLNRYKRMLETYRLKHGAPEKEKMRIDNKKKYDQYVQKNLSSGKSCCDKSDEIELLRNGSVVFIAFWSTDQSEIIMMLRSSQRRGDSTVRHSITYSPKQTRNRGSAPGKAK